MTILVCLVKLSESTSLEFRLTVQKSAVEW
jgi:hypothetical protein